MLILTANLGRGVTVTEFQANYATTAQFPRAVRCYQEIDEYDLPDEHAAMAHETVAGRHTYVPIVVPAQWRIIRTRVTKGCDGLAGYTPHRLFVQTLIQHVTHPGLELVVVNVHFPRRDPATATRRAACRRRLRRVIRYWHKQGFTVVWAGDTNTIRMRPMHRHEWVIVQAGLDTIRVVEGTVAVDVLDTGTLDLTIDGHNAQWARLSLRRRG